MVFQRIIPVLLVKDNVLTKSLKFKSYNYIGDPINAVKIFNEKEVDELIILDIDASRKFGKPNLELLTSLSRECFMPLTYGGGISSFEDIEKVFSIGVEKISLNQAIFNNDSFIQKAINTFGSQSIVASINIKKNFFGDYCLFDYKKNKKNKISLKEYLKKLENLGFGELFIFDVDRDGTFKGLNQDLIDAILNTVNIPIVFAGGASSHENINQTLSLNKTLSGIAAGSVFVYHGKHNAVLINYTQSKERYNENGL